MCEADNDDDDETRDSNQTFSSPTIIETFAFKHLFGNSDFTVYCNIG